MADLIQFTHIAVADGTLSVADKDNILSIARQCSEEKPLTRKEITEVIEIVRDRSKGLSFNKIPLVVRILSIFLILSSAMGIFGAVDAALSNFHIGLQFESLGDITVTTAIITSILILSSAASTVLSLILGILLLRGKRGRAGILLWFTIAATIISTACSILLYGAGSVHLYTTLVQIIAQIAFSMYLYPVQNIERDLARGLYMLDTETHAKQGTLGLADPGEGYIRLDFFNIVWTFIVTALLGLIVEIIFWMTIVDPGVYQDRSGLLFGPFSPIYGIGAVLMTIALNRFKDKNLIFIFLICAAIGGAFEYFASMFMEYAFGAVAWDYHEQWMGDLFDGRTCFKFMGFFGVLGCVWIKLLLPQLLKLINLIPWKMRFSVTAVAAAFMLVNAIMTVQALDNWTARVAGHQPQNAIEQFYADNYDNDFMVHKFESIHINPDKSVRA